MVSEMVSSYIMQIKNNKGEYSIDNILEIMTEIENKALEVEREYSDKIYELESEIEKLKEGK